MTEKAPPTVEEQVLAVLRGTASLLAKKHVGSRYWGEEALRRTLTIKKSDIHAHVAKHGLTEDSGVRRQAQEGICLVRRGDEWVVFYQERGIPFEEGRSSDEREAIRIATDLLIAVSGLGWLED
ncbi:MAG: hypothetical protein AAF533_17815 [Acidobacteriota bacterium]